MKQLSLTLILVLGWTGFSSAQAVVELAAMNGIEICAGYESVHFAHICIVSEPPIPVPPNASLTYTWTSEHPNGTRTWYGNSPERLIPINWEGHYLVRVKIEYIRYGRTRPFAVFWSDYLSLIGLDCDDQG